MEAQYAFVWSAKGIGRYGVGGSGWRTISWQIAQGYLPDGWNPADWSDPTWPTGGSTSATVGYFPAAGIRDTGSGAPGNVAAYGYVWSSSRSTDARYGHNLFFYATGVTPSNNYNRGHAFPLRCV